LREQSAKLGWSLVAVVTLRLCLGSFDAFALPFLLLSLLPWGCVIKKKFTDAINFYFFLEKAEQIDTRVQSERKKKLILKTQGLRSIPRCFRKNLGFLSQVPLDTKNCTFSSS
jgi:hypothetical protein